MLIYGPILTTQVDRDRGMSNSKAREIIRSTWVEVTKWGRISYDVIYIFEENDENRRGTLNRRPGLIYVRRRRDSGVLVGEFGGLYIQIHLGIGARESGSEQHSGKLDSVEELDMGTWMRMQLRPPLGILG